MRPEIWGVISGWRTLQITKRLMYPRLPLVIKPGLLEYNELPVIKKHMGKAYKKRQTVWWSCEEHVAKIIFTWFGQIWPNRPVRFWPPERSIRLKTQVRHFTCASPQMPVLARSGYTIRILKKNPIFTINQTIKDNNRYNILQWVKKLSQCFSLFES